MGLPFCAFDEALPPAGIFSVLGSKRTMASHMKVFLLLVFLCLPVVSSADQHSKPTLSMRAGWIKGVSADSPTCFPKNIFVDKHTSDDDSNSTRHYLRVHGWINRGRRGEFLRASLTRWHIHTFCKYQVAELDAVRIASAVTGAKSNPYRSCRRLSGIFYYHVVSGYCAGGVANDSYIKINKICSNLPLANIASYSYRVLSGISGGSGLIQSSPNKINTNSSHPEASDTGHGHKLRPKSHRLLRIKVALGSAMVLSGYYFYGYAFKIGSRVSVETGLPYAVLGVFNVLVGILIAAHSYFSLAG